MDDRDDQGIVRKEEPGDQADAFLSLLRGGEDLGRIDASDIDRLYAELRTIAAVYFREQNCSHTLQPTALVNEALAKMMRSKGSELESKAHFIGVAAKAMRHILIDHARRQRAEKRGGGAQRVTLSGAAISDDHTAYDALDIDEALKKLARADERQARIVELRFFSGMGSEQIASIIGVSKRTVEIDWRMARAWLRRELGGTTDA